MKKSVLILAACVTVAIVCGLTSARSAQLGVTHIAPIGIDEPPTPAECPLCGGDASLHKKRLVDIAGMAVTLSFNQLMHCR